MKALGLRFFSFLIIYILLYEIMIFMCTIGVNCKNVVFVLQNTTRSYR